MPTDVKGTPPPVVGHGDALVRQTRGEHDALLTAMHQLEAALASAAPGREHGWNDRVRENLSGVQSALERHVASAEGEQGLFAEIDLTRPTLVRNVERLRREHGTTVLERFDPQGRLLRGRFEAPRPDHCVMVLSFEGCKSHRAVKMRRLGKFPPTLMRSQTKRTEPMLRMP